MGGALNKVVFQPPAPSYGFTPSIWLSTKHGYTIPAFFVDRCARFTLLFAHGNAEDLGMIHSYFEHVSIIWNVNVFAFEYTGYGLSTGEASEKNVYADAEAAYNYLVDVLGKQWETIILYGRSLGSGACVHLATKVPVRGVILQSPLLSVHRVGLKLSCTLPGDMFANVDKMKNVKCPVFIIHGTNDEMIPVYHGRELYDSCKTAVNPYWVEGGGHNDLEICARQTFFENVARFLQFLESDAVSKSVTYFQHFEKQTKFPTWRRMFGVFRFMVCAENRTLADGRRGSALPSQFSGPPRATEQDDTDRGDPRGSPYALSSVSHTEPRPQLQPQKLTTEITQTPYTKSTSSQTTPFSQAAITLSANLTQRPYAPQPPWPQFPRSQPGNLHSQLRKSAPTHTQNGQVSHAATTQMHLSHAPNGEVGSVKPGPHCILPLSSPSMPQPMGSAP